jgi:hypothetical protein
MSSHYTPALIKAKRHVNPLVKIWVWRCADENCQETNESLGSEDGHIRILASGNELREPTFYGEKCEKCRVPAPRATLLPEVRLLHPKDNANDKDKGKAPAQDDVEMER